MGAVGSSQSLKHPTWRGRLGLRSNQIIAVILILGSLIDIIVLFRDGHAGKETHSEGNLKSESYS